MGRRPEIGWRMQPIPVCQTGRHERECRLQNPCCLQNAQIIASRVTSEAIDWTQAIADLDAQGCAVLNNLLSPEECGAIASLYPDDAHFRSRIVMGSHGFGRGEYKYFSYPLPPLIEALRPVLYAKLCGLANRWNEAWGSISAIPSRTARS